MIAEAKSLLAALAKAGVVLLALCWLHSVQAATPGREEQKKRAESEHADLHKKLSDLKLEILSTESARQHAADALADSEAAISSANRKLVELSTEQQQTQQKLATLADQQRSLEKEVERQKKRFSDLLRQEYITGNTDRLKLILSGDNPNRINRELQYLGYVSHSQNRLISQLRDNLAAVDKNRADAELARQDLDDIAIEEQQQKSDLIKEQGRRAALLNQLASRLSAQRKEAGQLQVNEQRLASLVDRLNQLIEQQRAADLLREQKRRADLAKEQAKEQARQRTKDAKNKTATGNTTTPQSTPTPTPAQTAPLQVSKTPESGLDSSQFAQLKGRLRLPTKGELSSRYGSARGEGTVWKGLFIRAGEGAEVKAIAPGKVIFADWLRGFGNLIIVDHGGQYMSIYGNNEALLKQAGATVSTGDVIATVGNSGGNEQSGLYFELRFQGKAFDPLVWISLK